jgi:hypothetical protein
VQNPDGGIEIADEGSASTWTVTSFRGHRAREGFL